MTWRGTVTAWRVSLLVILGMGLLYLGTASSILGRNLEAKALDLRFRWRGVRSPGTQVVLVTIDDQSIAELGRWPWSRQHFGAVVRRLQAAGARLIVFDLLFLEPEVHATRETLQAVETAFESLHLSPLDARLGAFQQILRNMAEAIDPDRQFASALTEAGNVVLAFAFAFAADQHTLSAVPRAPPPWLAPAAYRTLQHVSAEATARLPQAVDLLVPIDMLGQSAQALGHVHVAMDTDGTLRYEYPVAAYADGYYPSLAIQTARLALGLPLEAVRVQFGAGLQLGPLSVPTDEAMRLLVNYYGPPGTFPTYAFTDVLHGRLPAATFHDKIVLIGGTAVGVGDTFVTPFSPVLPGVERQATVIANLLRAEFLQRREATVLLDLASMVLLGLLVGWLSPRLPTAWAYVFALGLGGVYLGLNYVAFAWAGQWVNVLFPLLTIGVTQGAMTLHKALTEERQKRMLRRAFQYYLHPSVVEQVVQHPEQLKLGGEAKELTVLFSDIRGFSGIAEQLQPEALVRLLNEYLSAMTRLVLADQGLLDKYIGDAIMAVYGAPLLVPDHAYLACHTAVHMVTTLQELQQHWRAQGLPRIDIGVGINTGAMVVGNMGSDLRFNYTVMGDAVNLASRLEGANKTYGTRIIISEATWEQVRDRLATRQLDVIQVQGKSAPSRIFEVLGFLPLPAVQATLVQRFEAGLEAYRARHWDEALHCFQRTLAEAPEDRPSQLYIQRCAAFKVSPPPPEWDGVFIMPTK
jgi:adenylate cyclase